MYVRVCNQKIFNFQKIFEFFFKINLTKTSNKYTVQQPLKGCCK